MRLLLLCIVLLISALSLGQDATVQGRIHGEGKPLPGAVIQLSSTSIGTLTDEDGTYRLTDVPTGQYALEVRYLGYLTLEIHVNLVTGLNALPDINMEMDENLLGEVVVTGTMKAGHLRDSPVKVEVLKTEFMDDMIPSASGGIMENIQLINGAQEVVACGVCYTNNISINGLDGAHTAVLVDGMPMFGNLAAVYGLNGLSNHIIEQIEVTKGPSSTLYGSEAVAGVINIITKNPEDEAHIHVDMMMDEKGDRFLNAAFSGGIGRHRSLIAAQVGQRLGFHDENEDGFGDVVAFDRFSLFNKWQIDRKSGKEFSLAAQVYLEDRRNGVAPFMEDNRYRELRGNEEIYGESILTERAQIFGRYELPGRENVRLDFSFSEHRQDSYYGSDHYEATQRIAFANLLWSRKLGNHGLLGGVTQRLQFYQDNTVATQNQDAQGITRLAPSLSFIPGVFLEDEWRIHDDWTILMGGRLDHYELHGPIFSPRFSVRWSASDWTTLRFNSGTGFRVVNLFTEDHAFVTGQREVILEEQLNPEQSVNASLDLQQVYAGLGGSGTFGIEAFYTHFSNRILPDYSQAGAIIYDNLDGAAISRGISVNMDHRIGDSWNIRLGGQWMEAFQQSIDGSHASVRQPVEFAPTWTGLWALRYISQAGGWTIGYSGNLTGQMPLPEVFDVDTEGMVLANPRSTESPVFAVHHLRLEKRWTPSFSIYTGARNIFDYQQEALPIAGHNDPTSNPGFSDAFDTAYAFAPLMGRRIFLGLSWHWNKSDQ